MQTSLTFVRTARWILILGAFMAFLPARPQPVPNLPENKLVLPSKTYTIPFQWQGDSVHSKWEPHTAMLIPVRLKNCPKTFYMQFDSGSPYSLFYKNKLEAIGLKYPKTVDGHGLNGLLTNFSFTAGSLPVWAKEIVVRQFDSSTVNWKDKKSVEIIGTIGTDFIDGKVLVIDYPNSRLTIAGELSAALTADLSLTGFIYANRSILLPAKVQGRQTLLYFDTGSSRYELLTDKETCQSLASPNAGLLQSQVKSWDRLVTANTLASNDSIEIGATKIPIHYSTYMEGFDHSRVAQMMKMGIGGMTGNKLFLNYQLVLDTRNKKFGLIPAL